MINVNRGVTQFVRELSIPVWVELSSRIVLVDSRSCAKRKHKDCERDIIEPQLQLHVFISRRESKMDKRKGKKQVTANNLVLRQSKVEE